MSVPLKFHAPALISLSGASGSGKTAFTDRLIRNADALFDQPVAGVMYCYTADQPVFETMAREIPGIVFYKGVPTVKSVREWAGDDGAHRLLILDDLQTAALESKDVADIATVHSHHSNVSCVTVYQNLFGSGKYARTIALQAHYIVVMKNLRDQTQLSLLSRQIYPGKPQLLPNLMKVTAKRHQYPYILIDLSPHSDTDYRLRTDIFPGELTRVYALKS
jgi:hypothetical protein